MLLNLFFWYLIVALAGWLVFPLAYRFLKFLPDRGLAFVRPLGLLLWGYIFWLLVSLGVLQNNAGGGVLALALTAAISFAPLFWGPGDASENWKALTTWLRERKKLILTTELLFLALFAFYAVVRAANPDASGTEKPMELAFINSILRSPTFPPSDPWLSGYAISYYYFGYVMVALLAQVTATPGSVAFNLGLATWFALAGLGAYGLLFNLLALRGKTLVEQLRSVFSACLAPLFLLFVSNLEGFLEILHARGLFWGPNGQSGFWSWLNIQELVQTPSQPFVWAPQRPGGIWWWRASRVLQDFDVNGGSREIIDEFPMFSYLLGDLHPHVLAMPFVLLAVALALNGYLWLRSKPAAESWFLSWLRTPDFWLTALVCGGLSFLNTWDFPIYVALFAAALALAQILRSGWSWDVVFQFLETGVSLGVVGALLYLPFYLSFASQANGLLPSLVFFTRGVYFWVMFAPLLIPVIIWMISLAWKRQHEGPQPNWMEGVLVGVALVAGLWLLSFLMGTRMLLTDPALAASTYGAQQGVSLIQTALMRRLASPGTWITLFLLIALAWALLMAKSAPTAGAEETAAETVLSEEPGHIFVILLVLLGCGLTLFPEFFYLHDLFGWRMNTIFKFYFQTWVVWSVAAGYAAVQLSRAARQHAAGILFPIGATLLLVMSLAYPLFGIWERANQFHPVSWTLDGADYMQKYSPDEMEAIRWLQQAPYGTVAEAVGGSYTGFARVSTLSGQPAVLGWPGHESQWRGGEKEKGSREADMAQLYRAKTWEQAAPILEKYQVRYVYVGNLEQGQFRPNTALFQKHLKTAFQNDTVIVYEVPQSAIQPEQAGLP